MKMSKIELFLCMGLLLISVLLLSGCEGTKATINGTITDMRYYTNFLEAKCEVTFDNHTKYTLLESDCTKYHLKVGMYVSLELESYVVGDGFKIKSMEGQ